jgi:hypothetical protein
MADRSSALSGWTAEQIADGKRWVAAWRAAAPDLERIRRKELREVDPFSAIAKLCGPADYGAPPRKPKRDSGLVEQQRWFCMLWNQ